MFGILVFFCVVLVFVLNIFLGVFLMFCCCFLVVVVLWVLMVDFCVFFWLGVSLFMFDFFGLVGWVGLVWVCWVLFVFLFFLFLKGFCWCLRWPPQSCFFVGFRMVKWGSQWFWKGFVVGFVVVSKWFEEVSWILEGFWRFCDRFRAPFHLFCSGLRLF